MTTKNGKRGPQRTGEQQGTAVLEKGARLGKYEIERLIGVGSMGAVYGAVSVRTGERCAIKVLSSALTAIPTARARFLKEAKLTARVRHPHIVNVTDVGEDAGRCYFVMEMLEGRDLGRQLQRVGILSAAEAAAILVPVCGAVAEAHKNGITHRDLKPSNIFLARRASNDRRPHPIVLDFGIAKDEEGGAVGEDAGADPARKPVFGTPYYLAPEQVKDHGTAGPASDQHALGVILYECLTGEPPYGGASVEELFQAIAAGNPVPPSKRRPLVPKEMDAVVLRALSSDPKARFGSVGDLGLALLRFVSKAEASVSEALVPTVEKAEDDVTPLGQGDEEPRTPSSPAIQAEAATPSPFVRTLTPEVEALHGAWFAAGETSEVIAPETSDMIAGEMADGPPIAANPASEAESELPAELPEAFGAAGGIRRLGPRRVWIGAAAGFAFASLAVLLLVTRGTSSAQRGAQAMPAAAIVQTAPAPAAVPVPEPVPVPVPVPVNEAPVAAAAPAPAPSEPAPSAPAPSEAPVAAAAPTPAPSEPAPIEPAPGAAPVAAAAPAAAAPSASAPPAAPSEPEAAEPTPAPPAAEKVAKVAKVEKVAKVDGGSRARKSPEMSRARASAGGARGARGVSVRGGGGGRGVRMKNGVPLLD